MVNNKLQISVFAAILALFFSVPLACNAEKPAVVKQHRVAGEKLDSGLGKLPHYREWAKYPNTSGLVALVNRVPGEKLDNGLGELPPYLEWSGRMGDRRYSMEVASRR